MKGINIPKGETEYPKSDPFPRLLHWHQSLSLDHHWRFCSTPVTTSGPLLGGPKVTPYTPKSLRWAARPARFCLCHFCDFLQLCPPCSHLLALLAPLQHFKHSRNTCVTGHWHSLFSPADVLIAQVPIWPVPHLSTCYSNNTLWVRTSAIVWTFVSPPNSYVEILMPHVMVVLGGGDFGRCLGHEGGALTHGVSTLLIETPQSSSIFLKDCRCHCKGPSPASAKPHCCLIDVTFGTCWTLKPSLSKLSKGNWSKPSPWFSFSLGLSMILQHVPQHEWGFRGWRLWILSASPGQHLHPVPWLSSPLHHRLPPPAWKLTFSSLPSPHNAYRQIKLRYPDLVF